MHARKTYLGFCRSLSECEVSLPDKDVRSEWSGYPDIGQTRTGEIYKQRVSLLEQMMIRIAI